MFLLPSPVCSNVAGTDNPGDMSEGPSTNSTATQGDPSEAPPPPYGPPQPGYLSAELVDPPPQVGYSPTGDQTASQLQDIHSTATQGDPSEAPPPPYGPPQPGYLPAELVDPPPQVGYSPTGDQTASQLQDIHSTATQGDSSEAPPPPYGPPQPGYLPAELVDPPARVRYSPAGDQTARLQDIHWIDVVDRPARRITRQESNNWCTELRDCCLIWISTCGDICK